jgi:hypothetical protein
MDVVLEMGFVLGSDFFELPPLVAEAIAHSVENVSASHIILRHCFHPIKERFFPETYHPDCDDGLFAVAP